MVTKYKLNNNLTVILEPIDSVVSISAGLWSKTGSRHELPDQLGYAHLIEHMLFKGTNRHSAKDIARLVDRVGGQHNAATNREYTCYYINVISDYLDLSVDLLSDMYYNSAFDAGELEKEKNVILEEIRMYEDTPDELIHDVFMECMFSGHPLGHPILGTIDTVQTANRERLLSFYDTYYEDANSLFVIAGNFKEDTARQLIDRCFSQTRTNSSRVAVQAKSQIAKVYNRHLDRDLEQVHFCLGSDGINKTDTDRWALYLLSTILGGSMSSRLFQNIREKEGLCYSIYSFHSSYVDEGIFGIYCGTSPENFRYTLDLILKECRSLIDTGITREEFDDAKTFLKGNLALSFESTEVRMSQMAKSEMIFGRNFGFNDIVSMVDGITMEDFDRTCRRILSGKRLILSSIGNLEKPVTEEIFI